MTPKLELTAREEGLLVLIIFTGIIFRLSLECQNIGINLDETVTVYVANADSFSELIERIAAYEYSPPIYFWLMQQWVLMFGDKTNSVSIPSMISGTVLIPAVFIFVKELFQKANVALLAAFFAAVSPLAVFFSHEARLYSLFAVVMTFTLWSFVRCLRQSTRLRLLVLGVFATLLLYCHYIAMFIFGLMILSAILMAVLKKSDKSESGSNEWNFKLTNVLFTLIIAGVAFLPWLNVFMRHRSVGTFWVDSKLITDWPFVFASNLAATLPLPWIVGFCLVSVIAPIAVIVLLGVFVKEKGAVFSHLSPSAFPYLLLALNLFIPVSILGYVTPFIPGYCRYMVPFAVVSWSLLAAAAIFGAAGLERKFSGRLFKFGGVLLLVALAAMDFFEIYSQFFGSDRSGLRKVAADVKEGKFSNSAFLVAPDFDSATFIYYLTREQGLEKPVDYYTFPRDGTIGPAAHKGYSDTWLAEDNTAKTMDWIMRLETPNLTVIRDLNVQDSKLMPAKRRVQELISEIEKLYPQPVISLYKGGERSFEVYQFKLK